MQLDVISWFFLTSFIGVFADKRTAEQGSSVLLFENVTADNAEEVSVYVNGVENPTVVVTFKIVNGSIETIWKTDNYRKIFMDEKRNIWIANIDETYERKFYIQSSEKREEVELTILKTNYSTTERTTQKGDALPETSYSTTKRTALQETTQKGDALPEDALPEDALPGYAIALIVLMAIVILMLIIIMVKEHIIAWIQRKKSNNKPTVSAPTTSVTGNAGSTITVQATVTGSPITSVMWSFNGTSLTNDDVNGRFSWTNQIATGPVDLTIRNLALNDTGTYVCTVRNGVGSNELMIRLTVNGVPQPVKVTSYRDSPDSTSYLLMWDKPDDGGSPLIKYIIQYCEVEIIPDRMEYELSKYLKPFESVDNILPSAVSYELSPLTPRRYYLVQIHAINTQGPSLKSFIFKTKEGVPQPVQVTSHRDSPDSTSYKLMWDKPDDGGSPLLKYILQYCEVEINPNGTEYELSKPLSQLVTVEILPSDISYILSPLKPGSYYQVEVQAINSIGTSEVRFIFKTKEGAPERAVKEGVPQQVQVTSYRDSPDSTLYQLMWNKPDDGGSPLIKYIIRYCEVEINLNGTEYELSKPLSQLVTVEILPSDISYILSPLKPGSYYQVEVQAINSIGTSEVRFIFKTKEGAPERAVEEDESVFQLSVETERKSHIRSRNRKTEDPRKYIRVFTGKDEQEVNRKSKKSTARNMKSSDSESSHELEVLLHEKHVDQNF